MQGRMKGCEPPHLDGVRVAPGLVALLEHCDLDILALGEKPGGAEAGDASADHADARHCGCGMITERRRKSTLCRGTAERARSTCLLQR